MDIGSRFLSVAICLIVSATVAYNPMSHRAEAKVSSYIVQDESVEHARLAVSTVGGEVTHELAIIKAVGANLSDSQLEELRDGGVGHNFVDAGVRATAASSNGGGGGSGGKRGADRSNADPRTAYPVLIGADRLHDENITGDGVTIAVLDSGI